MAEGWLPPTAPGAKPPPRFDAPRERYAPPVRPQPQPPQQPQQPQQPARPDKPKFVRPSTAERTGPPNRAAIWAIWLGITGVALLVLSLGSLFFVTLPLSLAALMLARKAKRQIESGETTQGEGQATAALWLGRIGLIAGVAAFVIIVALIASGVDFEQLRDDLERELDEQREQRDDDGRSDNVRSAVEQLRAAAGAWLAR
jgi:Interferon-induced transmembrane protein